MKFHRFLFFLLLPAFLYSCKTQQALPNYLQHVSVNDTTGNREVKWPELRFQKGDELSIQIISLSTDPKIDAIYNQPAGGGGGTGGEATGGGGYLVDNNGDIVHHRLGLIHAEGMTKAELAAEIKKRLTVPVELLRDPTVVVRLTNFKVTMLGQVGQQGSLKIPGEKVTILEAIGMAGGVSDFGKKDHIKVLRELNGKRETGFVDLSARDLFDSPYYYLAQNDIIIVDETNQKLKDTEQTRMMQKISFAFTLVTVAATMANIFIRN